MEIEPKTKVLQVQTEAQVFEEAVRAEIYIYHRYIICGKPGAGKVR